MYLLQLIMYCQLTTVIGRLYTGKNKANLTEIFYKTTKIFIHKTVRLNCFMI